MLGWVIAQRAMDYETAGVKRFGVDVGGLNMAFS